MSDWTDYLPGAAEVAGGIALTATGNPAAGIGLAASGIGSLSNAAKPTPQPPPYTDPAIANFGSQIDKMRKSYQTGNLYGSEMRELKNQMASEQSGVLKLAKGNTGQAISALQRIGINTGNTYSKIVGQGQERMFDYDKMYGDLLNSMADRKLGIQEMQYEQAVLDQRTRQAQTNQNLMNMLAYLNNPKLAALFKKTDDTSGTAGSGLNDPNSAISGAANQSMQSIMGYQPPIGGGLPYQ